MIKVPIGKGTGKTPNELKFPNLKLSQPQEKFGVLQEIPSDRQFLKDLADQGRLVIEQGVESAGQPTTIISFIVPNGSTFYLIEANAQSLGNGAAEADLVSDGTVLETVGTVGANSMPFQTPIFSTIGNGIRTIEIIMTDNPAGGGVAATLTGYLVRSPIV